MVKGQVFTTDFILAMIIIIFAVILSLKLVFNSTVDEDFEIIELEAKIISDAILSEGSPNNWNESNVILPGILSEGKLSKTKLDKLNILGYNNVSNLLNTRINFFFYFESNTGILNISDCGFGSSLITKDCSTPSINARNIARLNRIVVNNNSAIKMVMLAWE